jgi:nucleotide-binding universal stress UspA family protein
MKILLPVDDSEFSSAATTEVAKRQWPKGTIVRVLSVIEPIPPPAAELWYDASGMTDRLEKQLRDRTVALTKKSADKLSKNKVKVESVVRKGDARSMIIDEAKKWSADLIVMGSHGYTGLKRLLLGSVALFVVSHAPCSVQVVRRKKTKTSR